MRLQPDFLCGSYPPVVTPFRNGSVDYAKFRELAQRQASEGSHGIVVTGTTGEPSSLTTDERIKLVEAAVQAIGGRIPIVAATGSQSLAETIEISTAAEKAGADALLIVTPYYIKPSQAGIVEYFAAVGERTSLPLLIYHIPGRAAVSLNVSTVEKIVARVPRTAGIKHAANDLEFVTELIARLGAEFRIFCGLESLSLPMLAVGAAGLMNAVGNLAPARVAALCNHLAAGDWMEARKLHYELFDLNRAIFLDTNPIPLKYMMWRLGLLDSAELRLPLVPMDAERGKILDDVLARAGLLQAQTAV